MSIIEFAGNVAAGTISGAIVAYLPTRRPDRPSSQRSVEVHGSTNSTHVDQSVRSHRVLVDNRTTSTITTTPSTRTSDTDGQLVLVALGAIAACLLFLFAWGFALGALLGVSAVTGLTYVRMAADRRLHDERGRRLSTACAVVTVGTTLITSSLVFFDAANGRGLLGIESQINARYPGYSSISPTRWNVLVHHTSEVFHILGLEGSMGLLYQVVALAFCALMTGHLVAKTVGTEALRRELDGRHNGWLRRRLADWVDGRRSDADLALAALFALIALVLATGVVPHLLLSHGAQAMATGMSVS